VANEFDPQVFHDELAAHRLIIPIGVQGAFGRGHVFEDVLQRTNELITRRAAGDGAEVVAFPPILPRKVLEQSEYLDSFPHLAGTVFSFTGNERQHQDLMARARDGRPWADLQTMTDVVLTPAACYPVYPTFSGVAPAGGRLVDLTSWCYRHEPSIEPTRMQAFRVREMVRIGTPEEVVEWRDMWLERGLDLLRSLGLPAEADAASDPFFGRGGRMMAVNQREQKLKFEISVPVISRENPTACCSFNYHQEHFGRLFDIRLADGRTAQTACLGFGLERLTMALFKTHGFDPAAWPQAVRVALWGEGPKG